MVAPESLRVRLVWRPAAFVAFSGAKRLGCVRFSGAFPLGTLVYGQREAKAALKRPQSKR